MSDGIVKALGAGSGIDTKSLVSQLVEIEKAPQENRLNSKKEKLDAQISAYGTLKSSLSELKKVLTPLANNDTFNARSVSFPDTDVITPNSVDPGAQTGTYQIEVTDVAQAQSIATGSYADKDAALGQSGTLTISFGKWTYSGNNPSSFATNDKRAALNITVAADDTLQGLADKINAENGGVQASVLSVDGKYQLLLTAPSGENNALRISSDDATKGDSAGLSVFEFNETEYSQVTETQQAKDAQLKINGLSVTRESNEIDDVIQGFDFSINKAQPGTTFTFSVTQDTSSTETAVRDFVTAYNLFQKTAQNLVGYSKNEDNQTVRGDLSTDGTAKTLINRLRGLIGDTVPGVGSGFTALTNVGIRTELDGSLSIDEDDFKAAVKDNFALIEKLFSQSSTSSNDQITVGTGSYVSSAKAGSYAVVVTQNPEKAKVTGNAISDGGTIGFVGATDAVNFDASASDFSFAVTVDGVKSDTIKLTGTYTSMEEVRADLQSLINGDSKLSAANVAVDVAYDSATNQLSFTSRSYGSNSKVQFDSADLGANIAELGFAALTDTGVNAAGTIGGKAAFGSGNVLLPAIGTDAYGLNFTVGENAVAAGSVTTTFSHGFAGEMSNLIDQMLANNGTIDKREESLNDSLEDISTDRTELDRRMEKLELRLYSQYLAMERIVNSFKSSGSQLDGLVDRLPFTAKK